MNQDPFPPLQAHNREIDLGKLFLYLLYVYMWFVFMSRSRVMLPIGSVT